MPTPFTHLASAQRLLDAAGLPAPERAFLRNHLPAFLLGSIAADGHSEAGLRREDTHFYTYDRPIAVALPEVLLTRYPALVTPDSLDQCAFVAGYIGHLALDEVWTESVTRPHFIEPAWGNSSERFLMLNVLLIGMDERDRRSLESEQMAFLACAEPFNWLPFLPDSALIAWRNVITCQLEPGAPSSTLPIISTRTGLTVSDLRVLVDSEDVREQRLWAHVPRSVVDETEILMQTYAREQVTDYLDGLT
ncbi:MAG: zinc dependent phospholipase C family protein [Anaerolineae bacterium]